MRQSVGAAIEIRQHGPAFERRGRGTTVGEAATDDDTGFRESTRNITAGPWKSEGNITRHRVVKARCTVLDSRLLVGYAREPLIRNCDGRQRVLRRMRRFGGHSRDRLPDIANAIACQHWLQRHHIHAGRGPVARQVADVGQIIGREDGYDTWPCARFACVDRQNPGVSVGRAQHRDAQGFRRSDEVRNVAAAASQESLVFEAWNWAINAYASACERWRGRRHVKFSSGTPWRIDAVLVLPKPV